VFVFFGSHAGEQTVKLNQCVNTITTIDASNEGERLFDRADVGGMDVFPDKQTMAARALVHGRASLEDRDA
jgi:hypothetical protein